LILRPNSCLRACARTELVTDHTEGAGDPERHEGSKELIVPTLGAALNGGKDVTESTSLSLSKSRDMPERRVRLDGKRLELKPLVYIIFLVECTCASSGYGGPRPTSRATHGRRRQVTR
jgi:hypothetical protein